MLNAMDPIPILGEDFQQIFPTVLLLLVIFNLFALWSKLLICLGLDDYTFSEVFDKNRVEDGKKLC